MGAPRDREHVLWVCFEDLKDDLPGGVGARRQIPRRLLELQVRRERRGRALHVRVHVRARQSQFDDHFVFDNVKEQMGFAPDVRCGGVQSAQGRWQGRRPLRDPAARPSDAARPLAHDGRGKSTGLKSYDALREAVRALRE